MSLLHPQPCHVLTDRDGEISWFGQINDIAAALAAMSDWLAAENCDPEDAAFILPILDFRSGTEG
jgi:hypothetical protein